MQNITTLDSYIRYHHHRLSPSFFPPLKPKAMKSPPASVVFVVPTLGELKEASNIAVLIWEGFTSPRHIC